MTFSPTVNITIQGNPDVATVENMKQQLEHMFNEFYQKMREDEYKKRALQKGYT